MTTHRIELPKWECVDLLRTHAIGRLCVTDAGFPLAFPVNYVIDGDDDSLRLLFKTSPTTIIGAYQGLGSLEVDDIDLAAGTAWSIIVRGEIKHMIGQDSGIEPKPLLTVDRTKLTVLRPTAISGRRFTVAVGADGYSVEWQLDG